MSDTTSTSDQNVSSDSDSPSVSQSAGTAQSRSGFDEMELTRKLEWGGLLLLVVAAVVATVQFYTSSTRAIRVWVGPGYEPLFIAAFNLAVLTFAVAGISLLARRLEAASA